MHLLVLPLFSCRFETCFEKFFLISTFYDLSYLTFLIFRSPPSHINSRFSSHRKSNIDVSRLSPLRETSTNTDFVRVPFDTPITNKNSPLPHGIVLHSTENKYFGKDDTISKRKN